MKRTGSIPEYICIFFLLLIVSCSGGSGRKAYYNENIPSSISEQIKPLDRAVIEAIRNNNPALITGILSSNLREDMTQSRIDSNISYVNNLMGSKQFEYLDQIYIPDSRSLAYDSIGAGFGEDRYYMYYEPYNDEIFISLLYPEKSFDEFLITLIYSKYREGWRLDVIQFGVFEVLSMNAVDYYKEAVEFYAKGHLIDASNSLNVMWQCIRPAGRYFRYKLDDEMVNMLNYTTYELEHTYGFPMPVDTAEGSAVIFNIYPNRVHGIYYPMIQYYTNVKLYDFAGLERENELIQKRVELLFPGITKNNKRIYYRAYNEIPTGNKRVMHYAFMQEVR